MTAEKNLDTSKQADKLANERLSDEQLDNVAGGVTAKAADDNTSYKLTQNLFGSAGSRKNQDPLEFVKSVNYKYVSHK